MTQRVLVGLSGVDSAYTCWLLKKQGFEVIAVHLRLDPFASAAITETAPVRTTPRRCDRRDTEVAKIAERIGVQVYCAELGHRLSLIHI